MKFITENNKIKNSYVTLGVIDVFNLLPRY